MEIKEILNIGKISIHEAQTKGGSPTFVAPWMKLEEYGKNKRKYLKPLIQREIDRLASSLAEGSFLGQANHPNDANANLESVSHIPKKLWIDKDNTAWMEAKILDTTAGQNLQKIIKAGGTLGMSARGTGSVAKDGTVMDDYKLFGIDIVASPSYSIAKFNQSNIFESVGFEEKKEEKTMIKETSEKAIQTLMRSAYECTMKGTLDKPNYTETFEEWKSGGGEGIIRATMAVEDGKYKTLEEALVEMAPEVVTQLAIEQQKVTPADCYVEARIAGADPAKYAEMINKSIDEQAAAIGTGWSKEERDVIYESAHRAGADISTPEARKKLLDEAKVLPEDDEETLFEKEAVARHAQLVEDGDNITTLKDVRIVLRHLREKEAAEELKQARISSMVRESMLAGAVIRRKEEK